jgi:2-acylglycerol O-acyltransferase 2
MATTPAGKKKVKQIRSEGDLSGLDNTTIITSEQQRQTSERDKNLRRILEDAAQLNKEKFVTKREVNYLREAFETTISNPADRVSVPIAVQCDNLLHNLEKRVVSDVNAQSFDIEGSDIKWKFTDIPFSRRMQTFIITLFCFFTGVPLILFASAVFLYFEWTRYPMLAYIISMFVFPIRHPTTPRKWWTDHWVFKYARDYFPIRLVIAKAVRRLFNPRRNFIFCYHPHGVIAMGAALNFGSNCNNIRELLPGLTFHVQTLGINFYLPFWRETLRWSGFGDASARTIENTLKSGPGESIVLVVGGAEESLLAKPKTNDLLLSKRKGFVKIALRQGCPLVPVFGYGENDIYNNLADNYPGLKKYLIKAQKLLGFAFPMIHGRGWFNYNFGPLPHRKLIVTVVGAPVEVPHIPHPSQEDIDHWHKVYMEALMQLYKDHKSVYDLHSKTEAQIVS